MSEAEREELIEWLFWAFEALVTENAWSDLTPRSLNNDFNWKNR